jgi:hypothetical protein
MKFIKKRMEQIIILVFLTVKIVNYLKKDKYLKFLRI